MSNEIDWLGIQLFETDSIITSMKMRPDGEVLGYYATCRKHGTRQNVDESMAYLLKDSKPFCEKCRNDELKNDWDAVSPFTQALIDIMNNGKSKPIEVGVYPDKAISFIVSTPRLNRG